MEIPVGRLPIGTYQVFLQYSTNTDGIYSCTVSDPTMRKDVLRTNGCVLYSGLDQTNFDMWLLEPSSDMKVHIVQEVAEDTLDVYNLVIKQNNALNRMVLFCMICVFGIINAIYIYRAYDKQYSISVKSKTVTFGLGLIILIASFPLSVDYFFGAGDLIYHLMRVEGIKDGILAGYFPVRISPEWQQGFGYASPIFYGETVLYIAGLLRLIGFPVVTSYRIFMFIINVATVLISYYCFKKIFKEEYTAVLCSAIYTLSIYRIYKTYLCGSLGECFGIMFLPLIVYGFYKVFTQDIHEENYKKSYIPLMIGFTMIIQSHLLTCEMVGLFTIFLCIILWKKVFRRQTFIVLAKTVIYSILLSAWFLVPFLDYMIVGDFVIQNVSTRTIQERGLYPAHLLFSYFIQGSTVFWEENGMHDSHAMGIGTVPLLSLFIVGYLFFFRKSERFTKQEKIICKIASGFAIISMLMSLNAFPWDRIQFLNSITQTLISSLQFPNRFLMISNLSLTVLCGLVAVYVLREKNRIKSMAYFGGMILLLALGSIHLTDNAMNNLEPVRVYNDEGMGTGYIAGAEYLPYGADASLFLYHDPIRDPNIIVNDYVKMPLGASGYIENVGESTGTVAFPLLYYKGYQVFVEDGKEKLECFAGENFEVTIAVPSGFSGNVMVKFMSPWYWRLGEFVSIIFFLGLSANILRLRRKRNEKML